MKVVLQRVSEASVKIEGRINGSIQQGILILLGIHENDGPDQIEWLVRKITGLRIFNDDLSKMNLSIKDVKGSFLVISQFTLYANTKKGNRPSYIAAAGPESAKLLYDQFCKRLSTYSNLTVETGIFGADMKVQLLNDGPVTIVIER